MLVNAAFTILFVVILAAISFVDFRELRVPDILSGALLTGGLAFWLLSDRANAVTQLACGASLAAVMWLVRFAHMRWTGRVGLGLGDVKLADAGAVWINPLLLPMIIFSASASGLVFALFRRNQDAHMRMPFAPFLALGLILCWGVEHFS